MKIDIQCGDIILFARPCLAMDFLSSATCFAAKTTSMSRYDHIGVVVENIDTNKLFLLEANAGGVTMHPLEDRIKRTKSSQIAIRQLMGHRSNEFKNLMWNLATQRNGLPYNRSLFQMSTAMLQSYINNDGSVHTDRLRKLSSIETVLSAELLASEYPNDKSIINTLLYIRHKQVANAVKAIQEMPNLPNSTTTMEENTVEEAYYCSQLVAEVLLQLGIILSPGRRAQDYIPADFSSTTMVKNLHSDSGYKYSPDLVITKPRAIKLHRYDSVYTIDAIVRQQPHDASLSSSPTIASDMPNVVEVGNSSNKKNNAIKSHASHEWHLSAEDMLAPELVSQLSNLHVTGATADTENCLEVRTGCVDVLADCGRKDKTASDAATRSLRTVGVLIPGTYVLSSSKSKSGSSTANRALCTLIDKHGVKNIYLKATTKSALKVVAIKPTTESSRVPAVPISAIMCYSTAPQIIREVARVTTLHSPNGTVDSTLAHNNSTTTGYSNPVYVDFSALLTALVLDGDFSERRIQAITTLNKILSEHTSSVYLGHTDRNKEVSQVNLALLCEVDAKIVSGESAVQIVDFLHGLSSHQEGGENVFNGDNASDAVLSSQIEKLIAVYERQSIVHKPTLVANNTTIKATSHWASSSSQSSQGNVTMISLFAMAAVCRLWKVSSYGTGSQSYPGQHASYNPNTRQASYEQCRKEYGNSAGYCSQHMHYNVRRSSRLRHMFRIFASRIR